MAYFVDRLRGTTTARWFDQLGGRAMESRARYYTEFAKTLDELARSLAADPAKVDLTQQAFTDSTGLAKSTLHFLFGRQNPTGKDRPPPALHAQLRVVDERLLASQPAPDALGNCALELKVWSYWPYRNGWLDVLTDLDDPDRRAAAESLVMVVGEWARQNPAVAAHANHAPPVAAVEDLIVLSRADPGPEAAGALLSRVIGLALAGNGREPVDLLNVVHEDLRALTSGPDGGLGEAMTEATAALSTLTQLLPRAPRELRVSLADELAPLLSDVMGLLCPAS